MGWAAVDKTTCTALEIQLSLTRREAYKLLQLMEKVEHSEKANALKAAYRTLQLTLDSIEFTLSR